jgi:hypothetical protein
MNRCSMLVCGAAVADTASNVPACIHELGVSHHYASNGKCFAVGYMAPFELSMSALTPMP